MSAVQNNFFRPTLEDLRVYLARAESLKEGGDPSSLQREIKLIDSSAFNEEMKEIYNRIQSAIAPFDSSPLDPNRVRKLDEDSDDEDNDLASPQEYVVVSPQEEAQNSPNSSPKPKLAPSPSETPLLKAPEDEVAPNMSKSTSLERSEVVIKEKLEASAIKPPKKERQALEVLKEIAERIVELIQIVFRSICACFSKKSTASGKDTATSVYNSPTSPGSPVSPRTPTSPRSPANSPRKVCLDTEKEESINATSSSSNLASITKVDESIKAALPWCYTALGATVLWEGLKTGTISDRTNLAKIASEITKKVEGRFFTNSDASLEAFEKSVGENARGAQNAFYNENVAVKFNTFGTRRKFCLLEPGRTYASANPAASEKITLLFKTGKEGMYGTFLKKQGTSLDHDCQVFVILDYRSNTPYFYVGVKQGTKAPLEITLKRSCSEVTEFLEGKLSLASSFVTQDFYEEYVPNK